MGPLLAITGFLLALWIREALQHRRALWRVPIRIHVNGTRGKSSVTRLIGGALRAGGLRTVVKTTGTEPRMIFPDGRDVLIPRRGKPNIIEQVRAMAVAAEVGAQAAVFECMALRPDFQWVTEHRMIRSTIGVITNIRPDHLEIMGPTLGHVARAIAATIPRNGVLVTAEKRYLPLLEKVAEARETRVYTVDASEVRPEEMVGFSYFEHRENVAVALKVAELLGVDRQTALQGMYRVSPDPGVMRIFPVQDGGKRFFFVSAFAANDPESLRLIWEEIKERASRKIVVMNCRRDRPERSLQLGELLGKHMREVEWCIVTGELTSLFIRSAIRHGYSGDRLRDCERWSVEDVYREILQRVPDGGLVYGMGNAVTFGERLTAYVAQRAGKEG